MPPRSSLTSSFSITDANNEVVCPLHNQDGSSCRKRCLGEKRYRSMQEHIRRAHPEHYIAKLPATEESFLLMINTPPSERPQPQQPASANNSLNHHTKPYAPDRIAYYRDDYSNPGTPRIYEEYPQGAMLPAATNAAAALASLHNYKSNHSDWEAEAESISDSERDRIPRSSVELPPIHINHSDITSEPYGRARDLLPSIIGTSPPGRSSTLPPLQRPLGPHRSRKQSISKRGKEAQHRKQRSRDAKEWVKRGKIDIAGDLLRPMVGQDRPRPYSAEPSSRSPWDDLLDAATSVAEEDMGEDRTPMPQSPVSIQRASLPPFSHQQFGHSTYQASPLQQALTPPTYAQEAPEPFPSVESGESAENYHMGAHGLTDSSPSFSSQNTQIYCAACQNVSLLRDSYACTECICGLCSACVEILMAEQGAKRKCPRCATIGGRFKPFQLDIR
ncbi:hypothetical protein M406DRAFT_294206 [Cryphonectria parasitica EP155]|uniref:RING zinc finger-like domain-containing protein n=1 Tax=Cryphonectria parasitica (strain ATCC 38755 / EP155) TaxID=660469 RepID=A0A9P4XX11_CRYP1|nr:uncharacterized protein M406DRAFT_294206 [Cryphonectria parasitica EP155]KAF3762494.1 hypothetical protein M406DRAFT_294206 [Cryphonectria parasitica EP155]